MTAAASVLGLPAAAADAFSLRNAVVVCDDTVYPDPAVKRPPRWTNPKEWGFRAAQDLTNAIFRITGARAPICRASDYAGGAKAVIWLGDTPAARKAGLDPKSFEAWESRVRAVPGAAYVVARTGMGVSFGVTAFLERCVGHYQLLVRREFDPYEANPARAVPVCDFRPPKAIPLVDTFLTNRRYDGSTRDIWDWQRRLGLAPKETELDGRDRLSGKVRSCHSFYCYCRPQDHFKDHPEYFSMGKDGKRHATWNSDSQLCFTNPDVLRIVTSNLFAFIEADRKANPTNYPCIYDFSQMDCSNYLCWCPNCSNVIARYNRTAKGSGDGGDMGLQLEFVNRVARAVARKYPDVKLRIFSYVNTMGLPKDLAIRPEKNVMIRRCDGYAWSCHMHPLDSEVNRDQAKALSAYAAFAPELEIWDYMLYGDAWSGVFPEVNADALAGDAKFFRQIGLKRLYMESGYQYQAFFELHGFLMGQLYRNPDADLDRLLDTFCRVYGRGAPKMREAIDFLRQVIATGKVRFWHHRMLGWRTVGNMTKLRDLMAAAYAAEKPGPARSRIAHALSQTERELARLLRAEPGGATKLPALVADFRRHACEALDTDGGTPLHAKDAATERQEQERVADRLYATFADLPAELKSVPKDDLVCIEARTFPGGGGHLADDPASSVGRTLRFLKKTYPQQVKSPYRFKVNHPVYLRNMEGTFQVDAAEIVRDGKYHWYRLGGGEALEGLVVEMPVRGWSINCPVKDYFVHEPERYPKNPNGCDFWVSLRLDGEDLLVDRLLMVRKWLDWKNKKGTKK